MPRVLKVGVCRVCSVEYALKDRRYKLTCSPRCAFVRSLLVAIKQARRDGVSRDKLNSILWTLDCRYEPLRSL